MPGFEHELKVLLFRRNPDLAPFLLRDLGSTVPSYTHAEIGCTDLTRVQPQSFKTDDVTVLYSPSGKKVFGIITETQQREDKEKLYTWPLYVASVREQLRCPVRLLVITPDAKTAEWASTPIEVEAGGMTLRAEVMWPGNTPVVNDVQRPRRLPELSVLSAASHGDDPAVLKAAEAALDVVPERNKLVYNDFIESKLSAVARQMWEDLMATGTYEWQSDFARKYVGQGQAQGEARAVLKVLRSRGLVVSDEQRARVESCTDLDQLDTWLDRAGIVTTTDQLFT